MATGTVDTYRIYWSLYGGATALFKSPYLYIALFVTVVAAPLWLNEVEGERPWAQLAVDVIPSLLGFSMGGMAITLAFTNTEIFRAMVQKGKRDSYFVKVVANFFHFILFQTGALMIAVVTKAYTNDVLSFLGFWMFSYSILVALALSGMLLHTARIFNAVGSILPPENKGD